MKKVEIYIETTIKGPVVKDGKYAAALVFTKSTGESEDRFVTGKEADTTFNRSILLAMIQALEKFTEACNITFHMGNSYIKNMVEAGNPEKWKRAEWKRMQGKEVKNKDLWELYLEKSGKFSHRIEFAWSKAHEYSGILQEMMKGEREDVG